MPTLTFEIVTELGAAALTKQADQIDALLNSLPGLRIQREPTRTYHFPIEPDSGITQRRIRFYVMKQPGRTPTTWNQVYAAVNSVQPAVYRFLH